jgi:hypothetical protein
MTPFQPIHCLTEARARLSWASVTFHTPIWRTLPESLCSASAPIESGGNGSVEHENVATTAPLAVDSEER